MRNNIITTSNKDASLLRLIHNVPDIPKPFEKDIYLFDTYIAGTTHIIGMEELEPSLKVDDKLEFFRDVDNVHDNEAIEIRTLDGIKIGYVPRKDNIIFARLMDAGKVLFAKISNKEIKGNWVRVDIKIYLHE